MGSACSIHRPQAVGCAWSGSATIAHVGTANAESGASSASSLTIAKPAGAASGHVAVAAISLSTSSTITPPAGWQLADSTYANGIGTHVLVKVLGGSEPANYTFTLSTNSRIAGAISVYSGVDTITPIDATAAANGSPQSTSHVAPEVMASGAGRMLIAAYGVRAGTTVTMPGGTTERSDIATATTTNPITAAVGDRTITTGPSGTTTATSADSGYSAMITIALQPAATGGGGAGHDGDPLRLHRHRRHP